MSNSSSPLLEVKNLKKYFKTPKGMLHAVDDVSFTIDRGRTLGVVGESGCGKSTTGRAILRIVEPTEGEILFDGEDIRSLGKDQMRRMRTRMQIIFQDPFSSLNPRKTVSETIAEPLKLNGIITDKGKRMERVAEIMEIVGLAERLYNAYPHELDGGRRQRIGIARALAVEPEFVICDEPISALDVSIQAQVLNMLKELQEEMGLTYLFIAHDLSVVKHISDRIGVMYLGKMVELADSYELVARSLHPYTKSLISAIPIADPIKARASKRIVLQGDVPSPLNPPTGCRFRTRCPYADECCAQKEPEWREVEKGHYVACHHVEKINA